MNAATLAILRLSGALSNISAHKISPSCSVGVSSPADESRYLRRAFSLVRFGELARPSAPFPNDEALSSPALSIRFCFAA